MTDWKDFTCYYIERLAGPEAENAFYSLVEADAAVVPFLMDAFRLEKDASLRSQLVEIIWQHQHPDILGFLAEALDDPAPEVWKCALDGLVATGGQAAIQTLEAAKQQSPSVGRAKRTQLQWLDEAIQQIQTKEQAKSITRKTVQVELSFRGDGRVVEVAANTWMGGVVAPKINDTLNFNVRRQVPDEQGVLNPVIGEDTLAGSLQINIWGDSEGYRELGRYLLALAEIDTGSDPSFHEHHEITSADGRTHLHIIARKPTRNST